MIRCWYRCYKCPKKEGRAVSWDGKDLHECTRCKGLGWSLVMSRTL